MLDIHDLDGSDVDACSSTMSDKKWMSALPGLLH